VSVLKPRDFRRAVALLFTSPTVSRYLASATDVAESSGLRSEIQADPSKVRSFLDQASSCWSAVLGSETRGEAETEVAVLMACLRDVPRPEVSRFLRTVGLCDHYSAVWLAAMARAVLARRTETNVGVDSAFPAQARTKWSLPPHSQPFERIEEQRFAIAGAA
jgi:hypothetical protein